MTDAIGILNAIEQGDAKAEDELIPLVYEELRLLAARRMSHESPGQTLQATALVHEAYIRLSPSCFLARTLNTIAYLKKSLFGLENNIYRLPLGQNQGLWSQNGDTMSPCLGGVFQLPKRVTSPLFCHSSTASFCGSFARHSSASSGLSQAS